MNADVKNALMDSYAPLVEQYDRIAEEAPSHRFSWKFRRRMRQVLKNYGRSDRRTGSVVVDSGGSGSGAAQLFGRRLRRTRLLVAVLIILLSISAIVFAVVYTRYSVKMNRGEKEWSIHFEKETNGENEEEAPFVARKVPTPKGYRIQQIIEDESFYGVVWENCKNPKKGIIFSQEQIDESTSMGLDAETDYAVKKRIGGKDVLLSKKTVKNKPYYILFWLDVNCTFLLSGNVELEELEKIVEQI